jgi:hypothetical protein
MALELATNVEIITPLKQMVKAFRRESARIYEKDAYQS